MTLSEMVLAMPQPEFEAFSARVDREIEQAKATGSIGEWMTPLGKKVRHLSQAELDEVIAMQEAMAARFSLAADRLEQERRRRGLNVVQLEGKAKAHKH